jgi:benzylsuccinate CoA-transferase BbsF subunit
MSEGHGIYKGLKILELGSGAASPVATRYFAEQGATVVRLESAVRPDFLRLLHVTAERRGGIDGAPMFVLLNPDKRSVSLNLSKPEAREMARKFVAWADVVSENFSPGVMEKWGLAGSQLRRDHPRLIVVSGCLFGQTGPQRHYPGFGGQGAAIAGFNHITGWLDREAVGPYATITDSLSPRYVALAIAAALLRLRRTGEGCTIDLSQIECGVYSLSEMIVRESAGAGCFVRCGNQDEAAAPHGVYPCAGEDRWIALSIPDDEAFAVLCKTIGRPAISLDARFLVASSRRENADALDQIISEWTCTREDYDVMAQFQAAGIAAGVVQTVEDQVRRDPQLESRAYVERIRHLVKGDVIANGIPLGLTGTPGHTWRAGEARGQDNEYVFRDLLGLGALEFERLVEAGAIEHPSEEE